MFLFPLANDVEMTAERIVGIDGRCLSESGGAGIETVVRGLMRGLATLDGPEKYVVLTGEAAEPEARSLVAGNVELLVEDTSISQRLQSRLTRTIRRNGRVTGLLADGARISEIRLGRIPKSTGALERRGCQVVHFPTPAAFVTSVPTLYQPHDLQHRHLPAFFPAGVRRLRDERYHRWCKSADLVVVGSEWTAADFASQFADIHTSIHVIPLAPDVDRVAPDSRRTPSGSGRFILYPAQTWRHKNHLLLISALARLRNDYGIDVHAVCPGTQTEWFSAIAARCVDLGVDDLVSFPGFVSNAELGRLYEQCEFAVIPSLFEAGSFPMWEAFRSGKTVAVSNVTSLPAMSHGAAEIFDPHSVPSCASAIARLWTDAAYRSELEARAQNVIARYSWPETSRRFRTRYRLLAGWELDDWDVSILEHDPLVF